MTDSKEDELRLIQILKETDEKIDKVSKQWIWLKHEYRKNKDPAFRLNIKKKWNRLQKKMEELEKRRRELIEKKNEIDYKRKWKIFKKHGKTIRIDQNLRSCVVITHRNQKDGFKHNTGLF